MGPHGGCGFPSAVFVCRLLEVLPRIPAGPRGDLLPGSSTLVLNLGYLVHWLASLEQVASFFRPVRKVRQAYTWGC